MNLQTPPVQTVTESSNATSDQAICESLADIVYFSTMTPTVYAASHDTMRSTLNQLGVNFEGRELPISLRPNVISAQQVTCLGRDLAYVRHSIIALVQRVRRDLQRGVRSQLVDYFSSYEKWFDLISEERRRIPDIMLMRFDAAPCARGILRAMESNAACPGGVIHCAHLRNAWRKTEIGKGMFDTFHVQHRAVDDPYGFVRFLSNLAKRLGGGNIVICNHNGIYTNELQSLVRASQILNKRNEISTKIVTADVTDIAVSDGLVYARDIPARIVYNKLDPQMIDPCNSSLRGWIAASRTGTCDFLNSFGAMYIGEAKSAFGALCKPEFQEYLGLPSAQRAAIERRVCTTTRVSDVYASALFPDVAMNRHHYVLKEDAATRGHGVIVGSDVSMAEWTSKLSDYCITNGVSQSALTIPVRTSLQVSEETGSLTDIREYFGLDAFFYGEDFAGIVSRCHSSSVFNVGNGGKEVPTIVVRPRLAGEATQ